MSALGSVDRGIVPKSLFNMCIELVAENLDLVESFQGFPSLIGEKIFRCAVEGERFSDFNYENLSLRLFTDEFNDEVLSTFNVSRQHLGLNFYIDNFLMFKYLVEMDVSYCGLGDDHEILTHISTMKCLKKLVLSCNALSDKGIQKLTTPYRMFKNGPEFLIHLDLTGNDVTVTCLKFLCSFIHLNSVLLPLQSTCTRIKQNTTDQWSLIKTEYRHMKITTKGWAATLINKWMENTARKTTEKQPKKRNFYSRSSLKSAYLEIKAMEETADPPAFCLQATKLISVKHDYPVDDRKNRKRTTNGIYKCQTVAKKESGQGDCDEFSAFNTLDTELLSLYGCTKNTKEHENTVVSESKCRQGKPDIYKEFNSLYQVENAHNNVENDESSSFSKLLHKLNGNDQVTKLGPCKNMGDTVTKMKTKFVQKNNFSNSRYPTSQTDFIQRSSMAEDKGTACKDKGPFHLNPKKRRKINL